MGSWKGAYFQTVPLSTPVVEEHDERGAPVPSSVLEANAGIDPHEDDVGDQRADDRHDAEHEHDRPREEHVLRDEALSRSGPTVGNPSTSDTMMLPDTMYGSV